MQAIVLGANANQADLIRYLINKGWRVTVCSRRANDPGRNIATSFVHLDITEIDKICDLAIREKADVVWSISSDIAITAATVISERLDLPHFFDSKLIGIFNNKAMLRAYMNERKIGVVDYVQVFSDEDVEEWSVFPCVVKPLDSQGQRGVRKVQNKTELTDAIHESYAFTSSASAIVEAYVEGNEISCHALVSERSLMACVFSERLVHDGEYFGIPKGHLIPPRHVNAEDIRKARKMVESVTHSLNIEDGLLYFQMIIAKDGPRIVEIAPRLDGCHLWRLIKEAYSIDLIDLTFRRLMGEAIDVPPLRCEPRAIYELMFQQLPSGRKFEKRYFPVPGDVLYHEYRYQEGQCPVDVNGRLEIVGYYICRR
jgi:biotin carboxylase